MNLYTLLKRPPNEPGKAWFVMLMGFLLSIGGLLVGYETGSIDGILEMPYFNERFGTETAETGGDRGITYIEETCILSAFTGASFVGALVSAGCSDWLGRKATLLVGCGSFMLGIYLAIISRDIPQFCGGRGFAGLGIGIVSALVPLYQSEMSPKWCRGLLIGAYHMWITIGMIFAASVNHKIKDRTDASSYRIPIAIQLIWGFALGVVAMCMPESPRYFVMKGKDEQAAWAFGMLRRLDPNHEAIAADVREIKANFEFMRKRGETAYARAFTPPILKRQLAGMGVQALQQLSGINCLFYYGTKYFQYPHIASNFTIVMATTGINVASALVGLVAIETWGRRPLVLFGAAGMALSQLCIAISRYMGSAQDINGEMIVTNPHGQRVAVAFACIFVFVFSATWGPVGWVMSAEIFPMQTRAKSISLTTATHWLFSWAVTFTSPYIVEDGDGRANLQSKVFFIWSGLSFASIVFAYFAAYETTNLSLEQIDSLYHEIQAARNSPKWTPTRHWDNQNAKNNDIALEELGPNQEADRPGIQLVDQVNNQADDQADGQVDGQADGQADGQPNHQPNRQPNRQLNRQTNGKANRQVDRQPENQPAPPSPDHDPVVAPGFQTYSGSSRGDALETIRESELPLSEPESHPGQLQVARYQRPPKSVRAPLMQPKLSPKSNATLTISEDNGNGDRKGKRRWVEQQSEPV